MRIGSYDIEREIGTSGTGVIYEAVHLVLPRRAIIKVLHAAVATNAASAVALLREACILEALSHAGIPKVYDSGVLSDRRPWFAVECIGEIDRETLAERMLAHGPMSAGQVTILVRDLAEILEHAHRRGVIHRGLRPDRISCLPLCIFDWSDARTHDASARIPSMLAPGSRPYVAPEVSRGDAADDRADVYALGVIAYQALTGAFPNGVPVCERRPDVIRELATLIDQMIAMDRYDRPSMPEIRAFLDELEPVVNAPRVRKPRWTPAEGVYTAPGVQIALLSPRDRKATRG